MYRTGIPCYDTFQSYELTATGRNVLKFDWDASALTAYKASNTSTLTMIQGAGTAFYDCDYASDEPTNCATTVTSALSSVTVRNTVLPRAVPNPTLEHPAPLKITATAIQTNCDTQYSV